MSKIILKGDTSGQVTIEAPAVAGTTTYSLTTSGGNILAAGDIGSTVQGYDADTAKYDDTTANFTGTLQNGGSNVVVDSDIGSTVQAYDAGLSDIAGLAVTDGNFIVGNGTSWVAESGSTARTSLGLGSLATLNEVDASTIVDNSVGAAELNVSGNGTSGQYLASDGDGTMTWTTLPASSAFDSGTAMLFVQTAAPTGWTKSTTHNDKALRVVSGTASTGGSVAFETAFASQSVTGTVGSTTLSLAQTPSHRHQTGMADELNPYGTNVQRYGNAGAWRTSPNVRVSYNTGGAGYDTYTNYQGSSSSHNHSFSGTAINLDVQYVDVIIATKD